MMLLMYHDGETMGAHSSIQETLAKLSRVAWWPSLARDVASWVRQCSVCKVVKTQPGMSIDQRMELHERPFSRPLRGLSWAGSPARWRQAFPVSLRMPLFAVVLGTRCANRPCRIMGDVPGGTSVL